MARIKKELATQRETVAYHAFLEDAFLKVKEVQQHLFDTYGMRMNLSRIYQLKKKADETRAAVQEEA